MAAIVRVKRRRDEDPADCLLLSCKKIKSEAVDGETTQEETEKIKSVFKFATTLSPNETNVTKHVREAIRKEKLEKAYKSHTAYRDTSENSRLQHKAVSDKGRLKVVSQRRALDLDSLDQAKAEASRVEAESSRLFCLYDVVEDTNETVQTKPDRKKLSPAKQDVIMCNNVPMVREKVLPSGDKVTLIDGEYVYDIYYMNDATFDFRYLENILAIEAAKEELVLFDDRGSDNEEVYDDEEDENAEKNWRNDYPDEESHFIGRVKEFSDDEDYDASGYDYDEELMAAMIEKRLQLNDQDFRKYGEDLSSDDEDHAYYDEPLPLGRNMAGPSSTIQTNKTKVITELPMDATENKQ